MTAITVQEAQARLSELIRQLAPGDELLIVENNMPVARIVSAVASSQRNLGTLRGTVTHMAADFDAPLDDFEEYMP